MTSNLTSIRAELGDTRKGEGVFWPVFLLVSFVFSNCTARLVQALSHSFKLVWCTAHSLSSLLGTTWRSLVRTRHSRSSHSFDDTHIIGFTSVIDIAFRTSRRGGRECWQCEQCRLRTILHVAYTIASNLITVDLSVRPVYAHVSREPGTS